MSENQMAYIWAKASPYEWLDILEDLDVFSPESWLSEKVICRYLMDSWWPLRHEALTTCTYLSFAILHEMSATIGQHGRANTERPTGFTDGPFHGQYGSVIPRVSNRRVCFVLIRKQKSMRMEGNRQVHAIRSPDHFFAVIFDYDSQRAYSFGAFGGTTASVELHTAEEGGWDAWDGPQLWEQLAHNLGWEDALHPDHDIYVVSKEWQQVSARCPLWNVLVLIVDHFQEWL